MAARRDYEIQTLGAFAPFAREIAELGPGRGRLLHRRHQGGRRRARRRHHHRAARPCAERAARLPAGQADGVRRHLPDRHGALRGSARRARQAAPQRRLVHARARDLGGAGLRLPLRLPGPAAHGDRPGAARARVQPRPHHHRADGALPLRRCRTATSSSSTTRPSSPSEGEIDRIEEPIIAVTIHTPPEYVGGILKLCEEKRGTQTGPDLRRREARDHPLRPAAHRDGVRLLRPAEVGLARLRLARLRAQGLPRRPTSCAWTCWSTATASTRCR